MKIVNKTKFIRTVSILSILIMGLVIFSSKTYSKADVAYKEEYIYSGDTLWSIAEDEVIDNKYFENKDIRDVVSELKVVNNLSSSDLYEGNKIRIPVYK